MNRERDQVLRGLYPAPEDARFYARAVEILSRPRRTLRTIATVANIAVYGLWLCAGAFIVEQAWDRAQAPFEFRATVARPHAVMAGQPVHVVVDIMCHRRCTYDVTWSVTDVAHRVVPMGLWSGGRLESRDLTPTRPNTAPRPTWRPGPRCSG